jgi:acyl-[acyl-carrier-protein]-phospholipid O-acyltransferase / long-chain-fatty-acid--[acyl-carrier-protein] ligase
LREKLAAAGLNPLAFPACYYKVEAIPKLGSGKTDFATAKKLALGCVEAVE